MPLVARLAVPLLIGAGVVVATVVVALRLLAPAASPVADAVSTVPNAVSTPPAIIAAPSVDHDIGRPSTVAPPTLAPESVAPHPERTARTTPSVHVAPPSARVTPLLPDNRANSLTAAPPAVVPPAAVVPSGGPPEKLTRLRLEVLVYSDVRAERMVFINGRKYVEGDTVPDGGRVEEIKQDGVVLTDEGRRFTLRQ